MSSRVPAQQPQIDLKFAMRRLWMDHILWTRLFIVSALGDLPDANDTATRLMRNQKDIGDVIGMFYPNASQAITQLLTQHIVIASQLVEAAKNKLDISDIRKQWYANADNISNLFQQINQNLNLRQSFYHHLQLTESEITNRLNGNYNHEISFFDSAMNQAVDMADIISAGLVAGAQQPQQYQQQPQQQRPQQRNQPQQQRQSSKQQMPQQNNQRPATFTSAGGGNFTKKTSKGFRNR